MDTWSTGVIVYTLLVGKPPFESKDVKSTYKRILANQYSFPENVTLCEHSKSLIQTILQVINLFKTSFSVYVSPVYFLLICRYHLWGALGHHMTPLCDRLSTLWTVIMNFAIFEGFCNLSVTCLYPLLDLVLNFLRPLLNLS